MTRIVVDASVALKWVVEEVDSDKALELATHDLWAPELLRIECANALWAIARRGELDAQEAIHMSEVLANAPVRLVGVDELLQPALQLALELNHPVYDCLYLALAVQHDTVVVTADRRFSIATKRSGYGKYVQLLA